MILKHNNFAQIKENSPAFPIVKNIWHGAFVNSNPQLLTSCCFSGRKATGLKGSFPTLTLSMTHC